MQELTDTELLQLYAEKNSEEAFSVLVARYVNLVYSTALRKTRSPDAAQEITQAVFIILGRKAGSLRRQTILSGWLHETTRLTAANFLRTETRRLHREQEAYMQSLSHEPEPDLWPAIEPLLDDAMGALSAKDRSAIVLRFFEGKSFEEVGSALCGTENAAKKRVNRALEKLRVSFLKRGVGGTGVIIGAVISAHSIQAAPAGLTTSILTTAANGSAVSASTLTLVKGTLKIMAWKKLKTAIVMGVCLIMVGSATTFAFKGRPSRLNGDANNPSPDELAGGMVIMEAEKFLNDLRVHDRMPGFSKSDFGSITFGNAKSAVDAFKIFVKYRNYPFSGTFTATKNGDKIRSTYHYTVVRASKTAAWQLQKAWRTDPTGRILDEYPVQ